MSIGITKHNEISYRAFLLWEKAGRPVGRDQEFWFAAEQEVSARQTQPATPTAKGPESAPQAGLHNRVRGLTPRLSTTGRRNGA